MKKMEKERVASLHLRGGAGVAGMQRLSRRFLAAASVAVIAGVGGGLSPAMAQSSGGAQSKPASQLAADQRHRARGETPYRPGARAASRSRRTAARLAGGAKAGARAGGGKNPLR